MGAKWLFQLRSAPGQQTSTLHLFDRFEALGAEKICKWKTQTTQYKKHTPQQVGAVGADKGGHDLFIVQFPTDCPDKCYMLIKQGDDDKVMEAGSNLNTIWAMMNSSSGSQPLYDSRCVMTIDGWAYRLGDFVMRVGSVGIRQQAPQRADDRAARQDLFRGAVLEVEYLASADRNDCNLLVNEIVDAYSQPDGPTAVLVSGFRPVLNVTPTRGLGQPTSLHWQSRTKEYTNEHRTQQYVALFHAVMRGSADPSWGGGVAAKPQQAVPQQPPGAVLRK